MASAAPEIPAGARARDFELLYRRYVQDVYRYALALLRNPADAEDVTQTTFMNAYRAYMRGEVPIKPQNWLIKIAHNAARTRYARASRRVKEVPWTTTSRSSRCRRRTSRMSARCWRRSDACR